TAPADRLAGDPRPGLDRADPARREPAPVGGAQAESIHLRGVDRDRSQRPDPGRGQLRPGGRDGPDRRRDERPADDLTRSADLAVKWAGRQAAEAASAGLSSPSCQMAAAGSPWISAAREA